MMKKEQYTVSDLLDIIVRLRQPDGCPWDKVQTHESIKKDMIEECYEAIDALDSGDDRAFANELGDVLLQVAFHSVLAEERGAFTFDDVVNEVCNKLIDRHTHVFGSDKAENAEEAYGNWEKNKKKEKALDSYTAALKDVPASLPALMRAAKVQKKAAAVGFDWNSAEGVFDKVQEEEKELSDAYKSKNLENIEEEYGDLLFTVVNLGRHLGLTPEITLAKATNKFIGRFEKMEEFAINDEKDMTNLTANELENLWNRAKSNKNQF
ncbi:MAG: nucleoside triphosphate pyrophosphohydrolase [Firmicutes bacterium]|nr:nucleoside triphosphate pyrophosphohydrolase [Bacillota bacterium]